MVKMLKMFLIIFFVAVFLFVLYYLFLSKSPKPEKITWGVNFSQMQAEALGLNWKKTYLAVLDELGVKNIKLHTQWDWVEGKKGKYFFNDIDWQVREAEKRNVKLIYVVGMKTGRWPECHIPKWAAGLSKQEQQDEILKYIKEVVIKYKNSKAIAYWQAENEPLFKFGECLWRDREFLKKEVALIKSLDPSRQVIVSDSGEQSFWFRAAKIGDMVGTTMYRTVWVHITDKYGFYFDFPMPPAVYWRKAQIIKKLFGKKVINIELQAEPWVPDVYAEIPLKEQEKTMNKNKFKKNIEYAQKTGFDTFYFWGVEWWHWLKETKNKPEIWNEAKNLIGNQ